MLPHAKFTAQNFSQLLKDARFFEATARSAPLHNHYQQVPTMAAMAVALDIFSQNPTKYLTVSAASTETNPSAETEGKTASRATVRILGQTHDDDADLQSARHALKEVVPKGSKVIFERDGMLHPRRQDNLKFASINKECENVFETALSTYEPIEGRKDTAQLSEVQRSWLVGLYIALSLKANPTQDVAVIFGDNHSPDMIQSVHACLNYLNVPNVDIIHQPCAQNASKPGNTDIADIISATNLDASKGLLLQAGELEHYVAAFSDMGSEIHTFQQHKRQLSQAPTAKHKDEDAAAAEEQSTSTYDGLVKHLNRFDKDDVESFISYEAEDRGLDPLAVKQRMVATCGQLGKEPSRGALLDHAEKCCQQLSQGVKEDTNTTNTAAPTAAASTTNNNQAVVQQQARKSDDDDSDASMQRQFSF